MPTNVNVSVSGSPPPSTTSGAHLFESDRGAAFIAGISRNPAVWGGRAIIEGTRIPVFVVVDQYEATGVGGVLESYPALKRADVHMALAYAELKGGDVAKDRDTYLASIPSSARIG